MLECALVNLLSIDRGLDSPVQVREIYETAVEAEPPYALTDADCKTMCSRYARLERQVGTSARLLVQHPYLLLQAVQVTPIMLPAVALRSARHGVCLIAGR